MTLGGYNHFANPKFYLDMMPPFLPYHKFLVDLSGVIEMAVGIAMLVPSIRPLAGSSSSTSILNSWLITFPLPLLIFAFSSMSDVHFPS